MRHQKESVSSAINEVSDEDYRTWRERRTHRPQGPLKLQEVTVVAVQKTRRYSSFRGTRRFWSHWRRRSISKGPAYGWQKSKDRTCLRFRSSSAPLPLQVEKSVNELACSTPIESLVKLYAFAASWKFAKLGENRLELGSGGGAESASCMKC